mgnify:CR=1 FL=1
MENLNLVIAKNLTSLRKANHLTQAELAEKLNYSDKSISKWENGEAAPSVEVLVQIGSLFGVGIDYFVQEVPPPIKNQPQKRKASNDFDEDMYTNKFIKNIHFYIFNLNTIFSRNILLYFY